MWLGLVEIFTKRAARGIDGCEYVLALDRNLVNAHAAIGYGKILVGRGEETEAHIAEALRLSPRDTLTYVWMTHAGMAKLHLGSFEQAVVRCQRAIEANRNYARAYFVLAAVAVCPQPDAVRLVDVAATFAFAALAWLVLHRFADGRLRSIHGRIAPPPKVTAAELRQMFVSQSGRCNNPYCRADLKMTPYEIDHIVPKSRGGPDGFDNAQLLCRDCNQMKCAQPWSVFLVQYQEHRAGRMKP
jgi:tetratricopeptide (TPR) repeat protein